MRRLFILATLGVAIALGFVAGGRPAQAVTTFEGFKCHRVTGINGNFSPVVVTLNDQFETRESRILRPVSYCSPAEKSVIVPTGAAGAAPVAQSGVFFSDPTAHLTCYSIELRRTEPAFRVRDIFVADQFGSRRLTLVRPTRLCVPSDKNDSGTDFNRALKCYKVRNVEPNFTPRARELIDQFGQKPVTIVKPVSLCARVNKQGAAGSSANTITFLTCYSLDQASFEGSTHTHDQFGGPPDLLLGRADAFCLPAEKTAAP